MKESIFEKKKAELPRCIVGCMRLNTLPTKELHSFLDYTIEQGIRYFDHADIYGDGECERLFGQWLQHHSNLREQLIIQSKCSIIPGIMYNCSKDHIITSVEKSLTRLQTDYLDVLLLHRPDALLDPEEVAEAFDYLKSTGKVLNFGVSNFNSLQIELLQKYCSDKLRINQLQFSIANAMMISNNLETNLDTPGAIHRDASLLDYCRLNDITIQAWSPLQYGLIKGSFLTNPDYAKLNDTLQLIGKNYNANPAAIALAWILRHPANMQIIGGSMNSHHFDDMIQALSIHLTREEWYQIYLSAGNILP